MSTEKRKILVIDDEEMLCQTISDFLEDMGYEVITAFDGQRGLESYRENNPDLIFVDLNMPEIDGFEVLKEVHKADQDMPIVVISGVGSVEQAVRAINLGAWDFITKPIIDMEVLLHYIKNSLQRSDLIKANRRYNQYLEDEVERRAEKIRLEMEARKASEERYALLFEAANDSIILFHDLNIAECNKKTLELFDATREQIIGKGAIYFAPLNQPMKTKALDLIKNNFDAAIEGKPQFREWILQTYKGREFPAEISLNAFTLNDDTYVMAIIRDITDRKAAEEELRKLSRTVEQSTSSVIITDPDGNIEYINPKFIDTTGYSLAEVTGEKPSILKSGHTSELVYKELWHTILQGGEWRGEFHNRKKNGDLFWEYANISSIKSPDGKIEHFVAVKEDITTRKEYEDKLVHQANYDSLTDLPNRVLLLDRLHFAIERSKTQETVLVGMLVDLDNFKKINDTQGHEMGDHILRETATRLSECVSDANTVARFSGDKFFIVLQDIEKAVESESVADKILASIARPFIIDDHEFLITASIGLTVCPDDGDNPHVVMRNAEAAMYLSKEEGRNRFHFFSPELNEKANKRLSIETSLSRAFELNEFTLHFQPQISTKDKKIVGAESLIRWTSKDLGFVPPDEFIAIAEDNGMIVDIGAFVLRNACIEALKWTEVYGSPIQVAVNVSTQEFKDTDYVSQVRQILEETGFPPEQLEIEITERYLVSDVAGAIAILEDLVAMGIAISIDDFGTGYSSLSYLKRFPISTLKIDKSFVQNITQENEDEALCRAIIAMGHSLSMEVVAEGVEEEDQLHLLRGIGCDIIQGYYYSKPLPAADFIKFISLWEK